MSIFHRAASASKLFLKANGPALMVGGGILSMGVGAIAGARKTLYLESVLAPHVETLEKIDKGSQLKLEGYTVEHARSDRFKVYGRVGYDCAKLYAVPVILFAAGATLVFRGHQIMAQRNATLALAFTGLKKSFDAYRGRVVEEQGSEADQRFMSGYVNKQVIDPQTGEVAMITTRDWDAEPGDPYARIFEQGASSQWEPDLGVNKMFIAQQERFAQQKLGWTDVLWLSDVYQALGFEPNDISRVVGWRVTRLPDGTRNIPQVSFGLDKVHPDDWKYSKDNGIYLDFNCSGLIVGGKIQKILENA